MSSDEEVKQLPDDSTAEAPSSDGPDDSAAEDTLATDIPDTPVTSSEQPPAKQPRGSRRIQVLSAALAVSFVGNGVLGWLAYDNRQAAQQAHSELSAMKETNQSRDHAMQVALDYAKGAAEMDYKDLPAWTKRLTTNTSPELSARLKEAASSMEQIIVPLQWVSTPTPITAVVRSERDGVFVVNCFVSVKTKNIQAPDGIQSTATYTVTIDKNNKWTITDVGGVDTALKGP